MQRGSLSDRPRGAWVYLLAVALVSLSAGLASAQRPSLAGVEAEVARTQAAMCALAEFNGDTYRPFFCPPECPCLGAGFLRLANHQSVSCVEAPAYEFTATGDTSWGSCNVAGCSNGRCGESSGQSCEGGAACPAGESCFVVPLGTDFCYKPCSVDAGCNGTVANLCDGASGQACVDSSDCAYGEICNQATCRRGCSTPGAACDESSTTTFSNVRGPDSPDPATCSDVPGTPFNSADMLECLALIESTYSTTCSVICGNGVLQTGEQCDDGNTTPGDGCAADCTTE